MVWNGRLPGASAFGCPGSSRKPAPRLCSTMPVSPQPTPEPKPVKRLWMNETRLPSLVGRAQVDGVARRGPAPAPRARARRSAPRARARVGLVEERGDRDVGVLGIGDVGVAVGEGELHRLDAPVPVERARRGSAGSKHSSTFSADRARRGPGRSAAARATSTPRYVVAIGSTQRRGVRREVRRARGSRRPRATPRRSRRRRRPRRTRAAPPFGDRRAASRARRRQRGTTRRRAGARPPGASSRRGRVVAQHADALEEPTSSARRARSPRSRPRRRGSPARARRRAAGAP